MNHHAWALTPPLGWNSWDCYGASVTEEEVRANAGSMARNLKPHGWEYVVVDIQWYEPGANSSLYRKYVPLEM
ncbi:MAG TPA: alpha-galactosidase, partial [Spirochaetia bacterium]|nr:alpha-galactosidase [Spirochaetia bacterium]